MLFSESALWAPDFVLESSGIACGDKMSLFAHKEGKKVYFSFICDSCNISHKVADYLEKELSGKSEQEVYAFVQRLRNHNYFECESWMQSVTKERQACVESPISLLSGLFLKGEHCNLNHGSERALACDACVSTRSVNWEVTGNTLQKPMTLKQIFDQVKTIDDEEEMLLQRLGKTILDASDIANLNQVMKNMTPSIRKKIKKLRLASPFYNSKIQYGVQLDEQIEALASKQIISMLIANEEIDVILQNIKEKGLEIDAVKGGRTNQYYTPGLHRTHMDYDFLAANLKDAFSLVDYLVNCRGFKLVVGGSVPFSFKTVLDKDYHETLTGHIHLEKILQDTYQVVVDINMGGFPLGRTGLIKCNNEGKLEIEDLICITTAHLFKHEHAFIKDINDLYYLLNSESVREDILIKKLDEYNLNNLFFVAYEFMKREMGLKQKLKIKGSWLMLQCGKHQWPYSRKRYFYIKVLDMFKLCCKQYGILVGAEETKKQICGTSGKIMTNRYHKICEIMNQRTYLYPISFFKSYQNFDKLPEVQWIDDIIGVYHDIAILPIGVFIIQSNDEKIISRQSIATDLTYIFNLFGLSEEDCNFLYIMEARKDTWLY